MNCASAPRDLILIYSCSTSLNVENVIDYDIYISFHDEKIQLSLSEIRNILKYFPIKIKWYCIQQKKERKLLFFCIIERRVRYGKIRS